MAISIRGSSPPIVGCVSTNSKSAGTSLVGTHNAALTSLPQTGDSIWIGFSMDQAAGTVSCVDSAGNTYTADRDVTNGAGTSGSRTLLFVCHNATGWTSGTTTVTVTHPSVTARALIGMCATGVKASSPNDQVGSATGSGTSQAATTSGNIAEANELAVAICGCEQADFSTPSAPFSQVGTGISPLQNTTGGSANTNIGVSLGYYIGPPSGATLTATFTGTSNRWGVGLVTYKEEPVVGGATNRLRSSITYF